MSELGRAWEENAAAWIAWARAPGHDSYWRFHRDLFLEIVPPPSGRTLDLGCGEGRLARDLAAIGHDVVGVDVSPTMLAAAREAAPEMELHLADAADLPSPTDHSGSWSRSCRSRTSTISTARSVSRRASLLRVGGSELRSSTHSAPPGRSPSARRTRRS